jgi:hypothetical protein
MFGTREPDFKTLIRICAVLDVTPNDLLLPDITSRRLSAKDRWLARVIAAARAREAEWELGTLADG